MKLYLLPGACSLASHIALKEAGIDIETVKVDIETRRSEAGEDYTAVNPKGYVPALVMDDGQVLTENIAILDWTAQRSPALAPRSDFERTRQIEMLAFLAAEVHKPFIRFFFAEDDTEREKLKGLIIERLRVAESRLNGSYLFGERFSVADILFYVMLRWARMSELPLRASVFGYMERIETRSAVRKTLEAEGLA